MTEALPPVRIDGGAGAGAPGGWTVRTGFDLPDQPWDLGARRWACTGLVDDEAAAAAALGALARGVGLIVQVRLDPLLRQRFVEDVHKAGDVGAFDGEEAVDHPGLGPEHRGLLDALADGATVTAAAAELHLSRRTANRRLAEARELLGTTTTTAAIRRWASFRSP